MTGRKNLVAVDSDGSPSEAAPHDGAPSAEFTETHDPVFQEDWGDEGGGSRAPWLAIVAAAVAVAGWSAFFLWSHAAEMGGNATAAQWTDWIADWSVPVLLVAALWLIGMRHSTREASRFGDAAQMLARESQTLEQRLTLVNRELSLARDFIAAQSRDLESLGRVATERLSQNADRLQGLIRDNGDQVESIGRVSQTAVENMDLLRDGLPVIANSARDVASQIGRAGDTAEERVGGLIAGFERLNEFGEASGRAVDSVRARVDDAVAAFTAQAKGLDDIATARFAELTERSEAFRTELESREVDAVAAIRRRASALAEELAARNDELSRSQEAAIDSLRQQMDALRDEGQVVVDTLHHGQTELGENLVAAIDSLEQRMIATIGRVNAADEGAMENARARLASLMEEAERVDTTLAERQAAFDGQLQRRQAEATDREATELAALELRMSQLDERVSARQEAQLASVERIVERGEQLQERLAAIGREITGLAQQSEGASESIARKAGDLEQRLTNGRDLLDDSDRRISSLTDSSVRLLELLRSGAEHSGIHLPEAIDLADRELAAIEQRAQALTTLIGEVSRKGETLSGHVQAVSRDGSSAMEVLENLDRRLEDISGRSAAMAGEAREQLDAAMAALQAASVDVLARMRKDHTESIREIAEMIARESGGAIEQALRDHADKAIAGLREAAERAGEAGRVAAGELRLELGQVNDLAENLERRVAESRALAEDRVDNDFSRRVSMLTESLNSTTVDIGRVFDNEVTDTAWASYLRGDRGIFTRRAVRLLDNQEQKAVSGVYEADPEFRETVNRYIGDFEAMLRNVLSTQGGHAMAVTLLSSDMGKLYVALAQAIDRLRT